MIKNKKIRFIFILILLLKVFVFGQDIDNITDEKMKEEILSIYKSGGEAGLRSFLKTRIDSVDNKLFLTLSTTGVKENNKDLLDIASIIAEEKKDERFLSVVNTYKGLYFIVTADYEKMEECFNKAISVFKKYKTFKKSKTLLTYLKQIKKAIDALKKNNFKKMIEILEPLLFTQGQPVDYRYRAMLYMVKGADYAIKNEFKKALFMFDMALYCYEKINDVDNQGKVYYHKGYMYQEIHDTIKAEEMFNKALTLFEKSGNFTEQGNLYLEKGNIRYFAGEYSKALHQYNRALSFFEKIQNNQGQGKAYKNIGDIFSTINKNQKALEMYDMAMIFSKKNGDDINLGKICESKGDIYMKKWENEKAMDMYNKALSLFENKGEEGFGYKGFIFKKMGELFFYQGENTRAIEMTTKALDIFIKLEDSLYQMYSIYWQFADIYMEIGNTKLALENLNQALNIVKKIKEPFHIDFIYSCIGFIYKTIGNNIKALEMCDKALEYSSQLKSLSERAFSYLNKSGIYLAINEYGKALEMITKAQDILKNSRDNEAKAALFSDKVSFFFQIGNHLKAQEMYQKAQGLTKNIDNYTNSLSQKGDIYFILKDYENARKTFDKLIHLCERKKYSPGIAWGYMRLGDVYYSMKDENISAVKMYEKALLLYKKLDNSYNQAFIFNRLGEIYANNGEYSKAIDMYDKALPFFKKMGSTEMVSSTLHWKAWILASMGKRDMAFPLFEEAIEKMEKIRRLSVFSSIKKSYMEKVYDQYAETAGFMLENNYYDKGFKYVESMKARVFLDLLKEGLVNLKKGIPEELRQRRDNIELKRSNLTRQITEIASNDLTKLDELNKQYQLLESESDDLITEIQLRNPLYASVQYPEPITIKKLQKNILKDDELLIRYFITVKNVYAFLISKENFQVVALNMKEEDINKIVTDYLCPFNKECLKTEEEKKRKLSKEMIFKWLINHGRAIYQSLFKPIEPFIKGKNEIIIIPDGELTKVPFESFVIDNTKLTKPVYLLEKYRIKYIQSASALSFLRKYHQKERETNHFIGFGDPVYDYENFTEGKTERGNSLLRVGPCTSVAKNSTLTSGSENGFEDEIKEIHRGKYDREGGMFNRLPGSGQEVETIAELFKNKNQKSTVYLREQANEENAKAINMKDFDYIHFSCHGILGENFQSLVLSQIPQAKEDGYLTLNEIMNCDYNAKLVVLSACQTGKGKMERAEGVTGLTRGVMYAGTPAVVASLWNVSDTGTKELMVKFYTNLLEKGMSKEEALRQAKLEMISSANYASPYYWSAFVMYGE